MGVSAIGVGGTGALEGTNVQAPGVRLCRTHGFRKEEICEDAQVFEKSGEKMNCIFLTPTWMVEPYSLFRLEEVVELQVQHIGHPPLLALMSVTVKYARLG